MHVEFWAATDIGRVRRRNEDSFLVDPRVGLAVVADGIGGQHRGDIASALAVRVVHEHLDRFRPDIDAFAADPTLQRRQRVEERLREAVQLANAEVFRAGETLSRGRGMGCTMDAVVVAGENVFLAHVGDARTYLVRDGRAFQLTEDHTVVQEKLRRGLMTAAEARTAAGRNVITRAIGALPSVRVDTLVLPFDAGQRLLLCSDGVTRYLADEEIGVICRPGQPQDVERVVELARDRGGVDNITAVLVAAEADAPQEIGMTATQLDELRTITLFEAATYRELRLVVAVAERRDVRAGTLLFREGDPAGELFMIAEGEVAITRGGLHLASLGRGETFGEIALVDTGPRTASALVTQPSRLYVLSRHRFAQLRAQDPAVAERIAWGLLKRLADVVRKQNEKIVR